MGNLKYLGLVISLTLSLLSCNSKRPQEIQIRASATIEDNTYFEHWDVFYKEDTFFVLSNWKTKIGIYHDNLKVGDIQSQELIKTDFGFRLSGQLPVGMFLKSGGLYLLQTNPYQFKKINPSANSLGPAEKLRIPDIHNFIDMVIESEESLILVSTQDQKSVFLHRYRHKGRTLEDLHVTKEIKDPHSTLVKIHGKNLQILFPYEGVFKILNSTGKTIKELSLAKNPFFELSFKKMADGLSPQEFMGLSVPEKLSMLKNEVVDFYFYQDVLFTITKVYDESNLEKLRFDFVLASLDTKSGNFSRHASTKIPLKFDQKGNLFSLKNAKDPILEISPIQDF